VSGEWYYFVRIVADYGDRLAVDSAVETQHFAPPRVDTNKNALLDNRTGRFFIAIEE